MNINNLECSLLGSWKRRLLLVEFLMELNWLEIQNGSGTNLFCFGSTRWKNLWAICAEDVGNYLRPSKQSRPAIGRLPNCSTNSRPGLNRIFLMVAAWLRLLGRILFQIWIQIFIQTNIFLFYFFSITSISNMFTYSKLSCNSMQFYSFINHGSKL